jgi:hypothetical protein
MIRIATVLIAIALGTTIVPSANAVMDGDEAITSVKQTYKKSGFTGIRISANPAEELLNHPPANNSDSANDNSSQVIDDIVCIEKSSLKEVFAHQDIDKMSVSNSNCCKQKKIISETFSNFQ